MIFSSISLSHLLLTCTFLSLLLQLIFTCLRHVQQNIFHYRLKKLVSNGLFNVYFKIYNLYWLVPFLLCYSAFYFTRNFSDFFKIPPLNNCMCPHSIVQFLVGIHFFWYLFASPSSRIPRSVFYIIFTFNSNFSNSVNATKTELNEFVGLACTLLTILILECSLILLHQCEVRG